MPSKPPACRSRAKATQRAQRLIAAVIVVLMPAAGCGGGDGSANPKPLALDVSEPRNGAVLTRRAVRVRGRVTPDAVVTAGSFELVVDTTPGSHRLRVAASKSGYEPTARLVSFRTERRTGPEGDRRSERLRFYLEQNFGGALEGVPSASWYRYVDLSGTVVRPDNSVTIATSLGPGAPASRRRARLICGAARGFENPKHAGKVEVVAGDRTRLIGC